MWREYPIDEPWGIEDRIALCQCGADLVLRVSPSPFPDTEATITLRCDACFAAGRNSIHWLAVVPLEEVVQ